MKVGNNESFESSYYLFHLCFSEFNIVFNVLMGLNNGIPEWTLLPTLSPLSLEDDNGILVEPSTSFPVQVIPVS